MPTIKKFAVKVATSTLHLGHVALHLGHVIDGENQMKNNRFFAGEQRFELMLELMKSRHSQRLFRMKKRTFDLAIEVFCRFRFYCFGNEITIT